MPFDWLQRPHDKAPGGLFARNRRARAIDQIRDRLQGQIAPSVELRLELVELLVATGRVKEAGPVLLGLADEFARDGFVAKAVAALKRIDRLQPGRADVETRLAALVQQQQKATPTALPAAALRAGPSEAEAALEIDLDADGGAREAELRGAVQHVLSDVGSGSGPELHASAPAESLSEEEWGEELTELTGEELTELTDDVVQRTLPPIDERARAVAYADRLLACDLFRSVPDGDLLQIVRAMKLRTSEPGEPILWEGERGEGLFVIATGRVKVFIKNPGGRNIPVAQLGEGQYFGEIASLSGRPRTATVTSAARCELLELDAALLRQVTTRHPALAKRLEDVYVERVSSAAATAIRSVPLPGAEGRARAAAALRRHFGEGRWEPRVRLKLAEALYRTEQVEDALAVLAALADELLGEGYPEKAVAVLKKIERLRRRDIREVSLAPLPVIELENEAASTPPPPSAASAGDAAFKSWLLDILRDRASHSAARASDAEPELARPVALPSGGVAIRAYSPGLRVSPLLEGLSAAEQLALLHGLKLLSAQPGDVLVSQGEQGDGLYILATGAVRVYAREDTGPARLLCALGEGAFFGEMALLSGGARSATVIGAAACELLELDRETLEAVTARHPRVRRVLEEYCAARGGAGARLEPR